MTFSVKEELTFNGGSTKYGFTADSDRNGIRVWLSKWEHSLDGMKTKRWASYGNDGTFVKRNQIVVPAEVLGRVKEKIITAITFEEV